MSLTPIMRRDFEHESVFRIDDPPSRLRGFLAIHSTALGPALGGIRILPYANDQDALADALRLSLAMTYKTALAELHAGGGKAVIVEHAGLRRTAAFQALGELIDGLGGQYFAGPDVGVTAADLSAVRSRTRYVSDEASPGLGNIAEYTAIGVWHAMRACIDFAQLRGVRVAIQGVGGVGACLARTLRKEGAHLVVADIDPARAERAARECAAEQVAPDEILFTDCDILAPCALGGVVNATTTPKLRARIVCGSANNVLATPQDGDELHWRGILYAPDYLVNAGGVIRGAEFYLLGRLESDASLARIYDRTKRILEIARENGRSPARIADELAEARWRNGKNAISDAAGLSD